MPLFRRKVSDVVATQFRSDDPTPIGVNIGCLPGMCDPPSTACSLCGKPWVRDGSGRRLAVFDGDWILPEKDGSGFYPVAADKFDELYEPAEPKTPHEKQYRYEVLENGNVIDSRLIDDPFVRTKLVIIGWRSAWQVFRHGLVLWVRVDGSREAHHVIFNGDYTPKAPSPQRELNALELGAACRAAGPSESY